MMSLRCKKVMGDLASQISIAMTHTFRVGDFLDSLSVRQYRVVELLRKLCTDVVADRTWANEGLRTTNICVVSLEAQRLENFP